LLLAIRRDAGIPRYAHPMLLPAPARPAESPPRSARADRRGLTALGHRGSRPRPAVHATSAACEPPRWGAPARRRLATGPSGRCATLAAPAQTESRPPGQAEFVVCDQTIERTLAWMNGSGTL